MRYRADGFERCSIQWHARFPWTGQFRYIQSNTTKEGRVNGCSVRCRTDCRMRYLYDGCGMCRFAVSTPVMTNLHYSQQNQLLAALSPREVRRLNLQLTTLPLGRVLHEPGQAQPYTYFPVDCIVSLLYVLHDGDSAEISVVGNDGLVGIAAFMGGDSTPSQAVVQSAGHAYQMAGYHLRELFRTDEVIQALVLRYTQALIAQMAQTAVCNRHHSVDQQLCRWLLLSLDRLPSNELSMTQELIANMLGVRREGVTEAAGKLDKLGIIRYSHGKITVLDRPNLEQMCCECYSVVKRETDRLRPRPYRDHAEVLVATAAT